MADKNFKIKTGLDLPTPLAPEMGGTGQTSISNLTNAVLPSQPGNTGKVLSTDGTNPTWIELISSFTPIPLVLVSSNITLSKDNRYLVDTTSARSLTLPASPSQGDELFIIDISNNAQTNNITVLPNGNKITGSVQSLVVDTSSAIVGLLYTGSTYGWAVN